ncbi:MAG: glycosyltransferase family 39 protein [Candidatus Competibacteraceae bacterium]
MLLSLAEQVAAGQKLRVPAIPAPRLSLVLMGCLIFAYLLPGLVGHDPWKADEAYVFGSVYQIVQSGDWVIPRVAGEPFMEKPPLYYLAAATTAKLTSAWLPLHDGARLASGLFTTITLLLAAWAARLTWGAGYGRLAILLLMGSPGLLIHSHMMLSDLALMAGFAVALTGLIACVQQRRFAGLLLGTGVGCGFLAKGLIAPGVIGLAGLLLPTLCQGWRTRAYGRQLVIAAAAAAPWLLIWPVALYLRSPELFATWFWDNNIGRFLGFSVATLGAEHPPGFWWRTYPWFLFPGWLFAMVMFYRRRQAALTLPAVQASLLLLVLLLLLLGVSASARANYVLPLLVPVAVIAAGGVERAPRGLDWMLAGMGWLLGGALFLLGWGVWASLLATQAAPARLALDRWLPEPFALPFQPLAFAAALALSGFCLALMVGGWRKPGRGLVIWSAALTLGWGVVATLWLPWLDAAKSYRSMFVDMSAALPPKASCIASEGFGESERAMLHYVLGIVTERLEVKPAADCPVLLVQGTIYNPSTPLAGGWRLIWQGHRPGDQRERFEFSCGPLVEPRLIPCP